MVLAADYGVGSASPSLDIWPLPEVIRKSYERNNGADGLRVRSCLVILT